MIEEQQLKNIKLAYKVLDYVLDHPELRFIQALWAMNIVNGSDRFYEPSPETLEKVIERLEKDKE